MTVEELKKAVVQVKAEGHSDEEIIGAFYKMFQNDELTLEELDGIVNVMGYHLTEDFKAMSPEDQKTKGFETVDEKAEGVTEKEVEDAKEEEGEKPEPEKEKGDDDDEEKKAMKLFGQEK